MRFLVTRPDPDAAHTIERLRSLGHSGLAAPLLSITFAKGQIPLNGVQALIATSRNALRALARSPSLAQAIKIPIFTVGPNSGAMATELGFETVISGPASARELLALIVARAEPAGRPLLVLRGEPQAFNILAALEERGFSVGEKIVYRSVPAESLPEEAEMAIRRGEIDAVMLMSPVTAATFRALVRQAGLEGEARLLHYLCLSAGVAKSLGSIPPTNLHVAAQPNSEEMLALVERMASKSH
jgi:uroporphyrinogen-III synthase